MEKPFGLSAYALVGDGAGRILVIRRSARCTWFAGRWDFPGGKVEPGETFEAALIREVREETGLTVRLDRLAGAAESEMPEVRAVHLLLHATVLSGRVALGGEHEDHRWIEASRLPEIDLREPFAAWVRRPEARFTPPT